MPKTKPKLAVIKHKIFPLYFVLEIPEDMDYEAAQSYYHGHTCGINIYNVALFVVDLSEESRDFTDPHEMMNVLKIYENTNPEKLQHEIGSYLINNDQDGVEKAMNDFLNEINS